MASFQEVIIWAWRLQPGNCSIIAGTTSPQKFRLSLQTTTLEVLQLKTLVKTGLKTSSWSQEMTIPTPQQVFAMQVLLQSCQTLLSLMSPVIFTIRKEMEIKLNNNHQKTRCHFASDDLTAILIMKVAKSWKFQFLNSLKWLYDGTQFVEPLFQSSQPSTTDQRDAVLTVDLLLQNRRSNRCNDELFLAG